MTRLRGTRADILRALHESRYTVQMLGHQWDEADVMAALEPFLTDDPPPPEGNR